VPLCPIHNRELEPALHPESIKGLLPGERPFECPEPNCHFTLILFPLAAPPDPPHPWKLKPDPALPEN
jgi:hypothetical protein